MPLLNTLQGKSKEPMISYPVIADFDKKFSTREEYIRVKIERDSRGQLRANRFANLSSGVMSSLSWADGLVRQDIDTQISAGQILEFFPLREAML